MLPQVLVALVGSALPIVHAGECVQHEVKFIVLEGDALMAQVEDDIVADLAKVGITVNTVFLPKAEFNTAMQTGDFHLCFTESWGPPYDPHTFATSWSSANEAHYAAMVQMEPPMTRDAMGELVTEVLSVEDPTERQNKWSHILQQMHNQAIHNPLWSRRVPVVYNRRLQDYTPGYQQYDYPIHRFIVDDGSPEITIAPAAQTGLFEATGDMDPHSTRPNEFFISNWIYESLVHFGQNGEIVPALATSWTVADTGDGGEEYRFTLRTGVKFHDGSDWNCAAAKLNFDHVLHPPLNTEDYHGWYELPRRTTGWSCDGEVFVVKVDSPYYPFLQELSFIRPLRMLSPESFIDGPGSDPGLKNSCPARWGTVTSGSDSVTCAGIRSVYGTGPWMYNSTTFRDDNSTKEVLFTRNPYWWGERGNVEAVRVIQYATTDDVKAALISGELDVAIGDKVLLPEQVLWFMANRYTTHKTVHGPPLYNQMVVINAAKAPTNDINVRKVIMHAVDKAAIVAKEFYGQAAVADSIFPADAPYCDIDLTPRWDYDLEKAMLLNCPDVTPGVPVPVPVPAPGEPVPVPVPAPAVPVPVPAPVSEEDNPTASAGFIVAAICIGIFLLIVIGAACFYVGQRSGYRKFSDGGGQQTGERTPPSVIGTGNVGNSV